VSFVFGQPDRNVVTAQAGYLALRSCVVYWSRRFDEPIVLEDGTTLRTLRDAVQYLAKTVPKTELKDEKVIIAADHLTRSAE
jgi:hypothetical protein